MSRRNKYTIEEVKKFIEEKGGVCLTPTYKNNKEKMQFMCNACDHIWMTTFKDIKISGHWCPKCYGLFNNSINVAKKIAESRDGKCLSEHYINNKTNMSWFCNKCEHTWTARLDRIKNGTWCPSCNRSHGERKIAEYLKSLSILFFEEYIFKELKRRRFDFFLPDENIAVEFDGIQHFQIYKKYAPDKETLDSIKIRDKEKLTFCINNKIKLLKISYNTKHIEDIIDFVIKNKEEDVYVYCTDVEKYEELLLDVDNTYYKFILTGVGQ